MKVTSSNLNEISFEAEGLLVKFNNGRSYHYPTADVKVYEALVEAETNPEMSVGQAFNTIVRPNHPGVEVDAS